MDEIFASNITFGSNYSRWIFIHFLPQHYNSSSQQ